jgi:acetyl esterase/lipase
MMLLSAQLGIAMVLAQGIQAKKETVIYKTVGGCRIKLDVHWTEDTVVRPVIFWIHGGALIGGDRTNIRKDQLDSYLEAGFAVVSIDYRLAPETKLPEIIKDVKDAYRWVRTDGAKRFYLDKNRIAVVGHSAGGYLTLMSGFCLNPRPKALVAFYGYGDIDGAWYSRPDPHYSQQPAVPKEEAYSVVGGPMISENAPGSRFRFYLYCRQHGLWPKEVAGFDPDKDPKAFDPYCPIRNVTPNYPPTFLLHGDLDADVPYAQSVQMDKELEKNHVEHELITIRGGGHGFDGARKREAKVGAAFERVLQFLKRHASVTP